jgi:hypothetical protein
MKVQAITEDRYGAPHNRIPAARRPPSGAILVQPRPSS